MSKEITDWKADLAAAAKKTSKDEQTGSSVISLKGGAMTYQDQALPDNKLECVVVSSGWARSFFDRPYDPDDQDPPECFANALEQSDLIAHTNVPSPMASSCSEKECEYAVFGSAKQGKGPACKTRRKLIVMPVSGLDDPAEAEIALLALPPTSGKNWSVYAKQISDRYGLPPWGVVTMITVRPHPKKMFEATFEFVREVGSDTALAGIHSRIHEAEEIILKPYTYDTEEEAAPKSSKKSKY